MDTKGAADFVEDEGDIVGRSALGRVVRRAGDPGAWHPPPPGAPGSDLTTLLLEVFRRRAGRVSAQDVLRQYERDRFVGLAGASFRSLRRVEDALIGALPGGFEVVTLSPVLPLGAHSAFATVDQNKVVSTIRRSEVVADPTNGLA